MQNSDSHDSSLQAILYIDTAGAKRGAAPVRHRAPSAAVIAICIVTAACAVGAVTYKVKQAPLAAAAPVQPIRVLHAAAQPHAAYRAAPHAEPHRVVLLHVALPHVASHPAAIHAPTSRHKAAPTLRRAVFAHRQAAMPKHIAQQQHTLKSVAVTAIPAPAASILSSHAMAPAQHRMHVHRRLAALAAFLPLHHAKTVVYAAVAPLPAPAAADPVITRFDASPGNIPQGSGASLCVAARHASQLSISGLGEVNPLLIDCRHVSPTVTTTYTTWAVNSLGVTVSQNVTITVTH